MFSNKPSFSSFFHTTKRSRAATYENGCQKRSLTIIDVYVPIQPPNTRSSFAFSSPSGPTPEATTPPRGREGGGGRGEGGEGAGWEFSIAALPWTIVTAKPCHRHPLFDMGINRLRRRIDRYVYFTTLLPLNVKHLLGFCLYRNPPGFSPPQPYLTGGSDRLKLTKPARRNGPLGTV